MARIGLDHFAVLKGIAARGQRREVVEGLLNQVNLWDVRKRRLGTFSGGMRQRFGIAQALLGNPRLVIVDEPTAGLDPEERNRFLNLLAEIGESVVVILSTHIVEDVTDLCPTMAIMNKGQVLQIGTPTEIYDAPANRWVADFIGETNFLEAEANGDGVVLADGQRLAAATTLPGKVTLAIRPERTELAQDGELEGVVENVVYVGTDTVYHLKVAGTPGFRVRQQNRQGAVGAHQPGARVRG